MTCLNLSPIFVAILPAESTLSAVDKAIEYFSALRAQDRLPFERTGRVNRHGGNCATHTPAGSHAGAVLRRVRVQPDGSDYWLARRDRRNTCAIARLFRRQAG